MSHPVVHHHDQDGYPVNLGFSHHFYNPFCPLGAPLGSRISPSTEQVFHICLPLLDETETVVLETAHWSFICGNGTVFDQGTLTCNYEQASSADLC